MMRAGEGSVRRVLSFRCKKATVKCGVQGRIDKISDPPALGVKLISKL